MAPSSTVACSFVPWVWGRDTRRAPGARQSSYHSTSPTRSAGARSHSTAPPSPSRRGVAARSSTSTGASSTTGSVATRSSRFRPSAWVRFQSVANVGFASPRSTCDSIERETPEAVARPSSVSPLAWRRSRRRGPSSGGSNISDILSEITDQTVTGSIRSASRIVCSANSPVTSPIPAPRRSHAHPLSSAPRAARAQLSLAHQPTAARKAHTEAAAIRPASPRCRWPSACDRGEHR